MDVSPINCNILLTIIKKNMSSSVPSAAKYPLPLTVPILRGKFLALSRFVLR